MNSKSLTPYQLQQLQGRIGPMKHYLHNLGEHMRAREFPLDDELLLAVDDATSAIELLSVTLECLARRDGDECGPDGVPVKVPNWIAARRKEGEKRR